jgi:hypothetical protein
LVIRSDDRAMSHSANIGREHAFGTGLSLSASNTPAARTFQATAAPFVHASPSTPSKNESPIMMTGPLQPRFTLMVTHVGIDIGSWAR